MPIIDGSFVSDLALKNYKDMLKACRPYAQAKKNLRGFSGGQVLRNKYKKEYAARCVKNTDDEDLGGGAMGASTIFDDPSYEEEVDVDVPETQPPSRFGNAWIWIVVAVMVVLMLSSSVGAMMMMSGPQNFYM
jgi:hypothetical protein